MARITPELLEGIHRRLAAGVEKWAGDFACYRHDPLREAYLCAARDQVASYEAGIPALAVDALVQDGLWGPVDAVAEALACIAGIEGVAWFGREKFEAPQSAAQVA